MTTHFSRTCNAIFRYNRCSSFPWLFSSCLNVCLVLKNLIPPLPKYLLTANSGVWIRFLYHERSQWRHLVCWTALSTTDHCDATRFDVSHRLSVLFSHLISCFLTSNMRSMDFIVPSSLTRLRRVTIRCIILPSYYAGTFCSQNWNLKSSSLNNIRCTPRMTVESEVGSAASAMYHADKGKDIRIRVHPLGQRVHQES
jgi:hypothetical protein